LIDLFFLVWEDNILVSGLLFLTGVQRWSWLLIGTLWFGTSGGLLLVVGQLDNHLRHGLVGGVLADIHHWHGLVSGVLADQLHGHSLILVVDHYGYNLAGGVLADSLPGHGWPLVSFLETIMGLAMQLVCLVVVVSLLTTIW
jgi:hypothetical protein